MRKITNNAVSAFFAGRDFRSSNTAVNVGHDHTNMTLHGNLIAIRYHDTGSVQLSNAGWSSNTTKERLNGILDHMNVGRVYQRDFVWYWKDGQEFESNNFQKV